MSDGATPSPGQLARISVVNGDLSFAPYPVLVGHFAGDSLSGSEAQLDAALGKALSSRYALGVYPAALGTAIVELHKTAKRPPGVVVGLGDMANFNAGTIRRAMIAGLLELALSPHAGGEPNGVSLVPLGAHAASVSTSDTLLAMLGAIEEVQRRLADRALRRFDHIQLIARMEDDAHRLWHALRRMTAVPPFSNSFCLSDEIEYAAGAARRIAPVGDNDSWRAIQIESAVLADGSTGFHFASVGNRARAEGYLVGTNQTFVQSFISGAVSGQTARLPGSSPARALFELVWPRELKPYG